jgi:hypothetical protein
MNWILAAFVVALIVVAFAFLWVVVLRPAIKKQRANKSSGPKMA